MPPESAMKSSIDTTMECESICVGMVDHGLTKGGDHAAPDHIRLLLDCAEICQTAATFMARGSAFHAQTCRICADICERCAESCERIADDEEMRHCAEVCRRCAESCREMAGATA
jgi:hypothetical protein